MENKSILILAIIITGSFLVSLTYAASTIITDTSISTTNLTVTGSCTGCGGGEGSFTSYSTILNQTISGTGSSPVNRIQIGNDGSVIAIEGSHVATILFKNGTIIDQRTGLDNLATVKGWQLTDKSMTGKYMIILDDPNSVIKVYKDNILLQNIGYDATQFFIGGADTPGAAISDDGKYITMYAEDSGGLLDRVLIFEGA